MAPKDVHEAQKNVSIDENEKTVTIVLNPRLYPQSVIMRAAYRFTEDFDVSVDGDPLDKITAVFKVRAEDKKDAAKKDLEEIADTFYNELLHASVEETQARRYADTRNALIGAAVRQLMPAQIDPKLLAETLRTYSEKNEKQPVTEIPTRTLVGEKTCKTGEKSVFDKVYHYMPKLNCGRCGANCEKTAKKIISGECSIEICHNLKKPEFSVVREEMEKTMRDLQIGAASYARRN